jgi:hypothetical protein
MAKIPCFCGRILSKQIQDWMSLLNIQGFLGSHQNCILCITMTVPFGDIGPISFFLSFIKVGIEANNEFFKETHSKIVSS